MSNIEYFDIHNIDQVLLPDTPLGTLAKNYWVPLVKQNGPTIIQNAHFTCNLVKINDNIIPIVINIHSPDCALISPSCYFLLNGAVAFQDNQNPLIKLMFKTIKALSQVARNLHFDKTVQINQWLLPTNPFLDLNQAEVEALVALLKNKFPDCALVFKGVTKEYSEQTYHAGKVLHTCFLKTRWLYIWDMKNTKASHRRKLKEDEAIPKNDTYTFQEGAKLDSAERFNQLYTYLYRDKHSPYNPAYTTDFFALLIRSSFFKPVIVHHSDQVDAFYFYFDNGPILSMGLIGYDTELPQEHKLYRRCIRRSIAESERIQKPICLGAGSGAFKHHRGALPISEYDLCFISHLRWWQQMFWRGMSGITRSKLMDYFIKRV